MSEANEVKRLTISSPKRTVMCVCDFCGLNATDEQYIYGPGVIHHDVECGHCNASYCFDDYSQVT